MQPLARALLLAAGFFVTVHVSLSSAAEADPAEPPASPHMNRDSAVDIPVAPPAVETTAPDIQAPAAASPAPDGAATVPPPPAVTAAPPAQTTFTPTTMDLTLRPTSLWQRIRNGFGLPDMSSPLVREQEDWYARRPDYISRTVARSSRYLYYIVEQIEKRNMPSEIALLPIIESAYNPVAYSRAHASGIWQFIPSTGKLYGLQQNFWYDGRRDVTAATNAALDYLEKLYEMFGTWDLALAAYNWGEGAVSRAVAKNVAKGLPTDYRSLTMPAETRYYMPKLQAVKNIIANPAQFGIDLADVPNQPYFVEVPATKHIDVKVAAKMAGMDVDDFRSLNPGNSRPVIRADGERVLLVPADKADSFRSNMENNDEPLVSWQAYKLKPGETLDRIAARYGTSVAQLRAVNGISPKHSASSGAVLLVPAGATSKPYLPDLPAPAIAAARGSKKTAQHGGRKRGATAANKATKRLTPARKTAAVKGGKKPAR